MSEYDIQCWSCKDPVTLEARRENDGDCPNCSSELDLEDYFCSLARDNAELQQQLGDITEKGRLVLSGMAKHQPKEYMRHITKGMLIKYT